VGAQVADKADQAAAERNENLAFPDRTDHQEAERDRHPYQARANRGQQ